MEIKTVDIKDLKFSEYNPRTLTEKEFNDLKKSLEKFGFVEPIVVNSAPNRKNIVIGGHQRIRVAERMGIKGLPVHYVKISDITREQELNLRLNKNLGHWDYDLLANFDEDMLFGVGFDKEELMVNFGLGRVEDVVVDEERMNVITVEAPEAVRLKMRKSFYCETMEEFNRIKDYFGINKGAVLDKNKLLEMMKND